MYIQTQGLYSLSEGFIFRVRAWSYKTTRRHLGRLLPYASMPPLKGCYCVVAELAAKPELFCALGNYDSRARARSVARLLQGWLRQRDKVGDCTMPTR